MVEIKAKNFLKGEQYGQKIAGSAGYVGILETAGPLDFWSVPSFPESMSRIPACRSSWDRTVELAGFLLMASPLAISEGAAPRPRYQHQPS